MTTCDRPNGFTLIELLVVIAIIAIPSLWIFWLSLNESTYGQAPVFVGLANYAKLLADRYFWRAFVNPFVVVNVIVYVEMALALAIDSAFVASHHVLRIVMIVIVAPTLFRRFLRSTPNPPPSRP